MIAGDETRCGRIARFVRLESDFNGKRYPCWRLKWQQIVQFAGGVVAKSCPIVIRYRGSTQRAFRERLKLERYGYVAVTMEKQARGTHEFPRQTGD